MSGSSAPIILILVFAAVIFLKRSKSASIKGKIGEMAVARELSRLPSDLCFVFNDVLIPTESGTTQIDHVVVAPQGIFVIETKNYKGAVQRIQEKLSTDEQKIRAGICPRCGGSLVRKECKYGAFYGCSNYPKCRFTKK